LIASRLSHEFSLSDSDFGFVHVSLPQDIQNKLVIRASIFYVIVPFISFESPSPGMYVFRKLRVHTHVPSSYDVIRTR